MTSRYPTEEDDFGPPGVPDFDEIQPPPVSVLSEARARDRGLSPEREEIARCAPDQFTGKIYPLDAFWPGECPLSVGQFVREGRLTIRITQIHNAANGTVILGEATLPDGTPMQYVVTQPVAHPLADCGFLDHLTASLNLPRNTNRDVLRGLLMEYEAL